MRSGPQVPAKRTPPICPPMCLLPLGPHVPAGLRLATSLDNTGAGLRHELCSPGMQGQWLRDHSWLPSLGAAPCLSHPIWIPKALGRPMSKHTGTQRATQPLPSEPAAPLRLGSASDGEKGTVGDTHSGWERFGAPGSSLQGLKGKERGNEAPYLSHGRNRPSRGRAL